MKRRIQPILFIILVLFAASACSKSTNYTAPTETTTNPETTQVAGAIEHPVTYQLPSDYTKKKGVSVANRICYYRTIKVNNQFNDLNLAVSNLTSQDIKGTSDAVTDEDLKNFLIKSVTESDQIYNASLKYNEPGFKRLNNSIIEKEVDGKKFICTYQPVSKSLYAYVGLYKYGNDVAKVELI
jgi:hypothetical protein